MNKLFVFAVSVLALCSGCHKEQNSSERPDVILRRCDSKEDAKWFLDHMVVPEGRVIVVGYDEDERWFPGKNK